MTRDDRVRRDALQRCVAGRLVACNEAELRVLDAALDALERARVERGLDELVRNARPPEPVLFAFDMTDLEEHSDG